MPTKRQQEIQEAILGKRYDLSVAFLSPHSMRGVTRRTKNKDKASNVLSFPLSKTSGEILLCRETARKEAPQWGIPYRDFLAYLFIHGLLHLRGFKHGATMERQERRFLKRFGYRFDFF
jgi:probable rRNA maturation factor